MPLYDSIEYTQHAIDQMRSRQSAVPTLNLPCELAKATPDGVANGISNSAIYG